jgi:hypothetical protein
MLLVVVLELLLVAYIERWAAPVVECSHIGPGHAAQSSAPRPIRCRLPDVCWT